MIKQRMGFPKPKAPIKQMHLQNNDKCLLTFSSSSGVILLPGAGSALVTSAGFIKVTPAAAARSSALRQRKDFVWQEKISLILGMYINVLTH